MKEFTIQLSKGRLFTKSPEREVIRHLISMGDLILNDDPLISDNFEANYDSETGIVRIIVDDGKNLNDLRNRVGSFVSDERKFK